MLVDPLRCGAVPHTVRNRKAASGISCISTEREIVTSLASSDLWMHARYSGRARNNSTLSVMEASLRASGAFSSDGLVMVSLKLEVS